MPVDQYSRHIEVNFPYGSPKPHKYRDVYPSIGVNDRLELRRRLPEGAFITVAAYQAEHYAWFRDVA